jgi:hypothetical protein
MCTALHSVAQQQQHQQQQQQQQQQRAPHQLQQRMFGQPADTLSLPQHAVRIM